MKAAIFSCPGLGDGLISLALAYNLYLNEYIVDVYHGNLSQMQSFFSFVTIKNIHSVHIPDIISSYDKIFISYDDTDAFVIKLIKEGKEHFKKKVFVLNPCPSKKIGSQPYYKDALFNPNFCMVDNIDFFCKKILKLKKTSKKFDLLISKDFIFRKHTKRVIIHPSSAKKSKNLTLDKYIKLAKSLKKIDYLPVFVVSEKEKKDFLKIEQEGFLLRSFDNLKDLFYYVYESNYMIGNDSGIGHLASLISLPTISIFRNYRSAKLWRPGWGKNITLYPNRFVLNLFFYRLRDKHWTAFIPVEKILKAFLKITSAAFLILSLLHLSFHICGNYRLC